MLSKPHPEPRKDVEAQLSALCDPSHPKDVVYLAPGTELPPRDDFENPGWERALFDEMRRVVDLLHGRADIEPRPGHASGYYTADVSPWVLAWIIGREWEPFSVVNYNRLRPARTRFTISVETPRCIASAVAVTSAAPGLPNGRSAASARASPRSSATT